MEAATTQVAQPTPSPEANPLAPTAPVVSPQESKPTQLDSDRFAALAKKEAIFVQKQREFAKQRDEVQKQIEAQKQFDEQWKKDPINALKSKGLSETDIFNWLAQSEKKEPTPEERAAAAARAEIQNFETKQLEAQKQAQADAEKQVLDRFKVRINAHLKTNSQKFKASNTYGEVAEDAAYRLIEQYAKDNQGHILSFDEAFETLEDYYKGEYEALKKIYEPEPPKTEVEPEVRPVSRETKPTKTLTNQITPTTPAVSAPKKETSSQKRERLIEWMKAGVKGK